MGREVHSLSLVVARDENGSDTDGYHRYYICFHISVRIRIRIRIVSTMSDRIRLDIDIINMRFEYSDTDTVSDVGYPDSDTDRSQPLQTDSVSNTVGKYPYHFSSLEEMMMIAAGGHESDGGPTVRQPRVLRT